MTNAWNRWLVLATSVLTLLSTSDAQAQVLGAFRWQFAPYCNVVTLRVEQTGSTYELSGTDNRCGGSVAAAARGTAHLNPDGTVGMGLTIHRPDGIPVHVTVSLNGGTLSGTWRDNFNNAGTFLRDPPAAPGGAVRPITIVGNYLIAYAAASVANNGRRGSASASRCRETRRRCGQLHCRRGAPTANCPGSSAAPTAARHLCVYETTGSNVGFGASPAPERATRATRPTPPGRRCSCRRRAAAR